jgi:16S rRNA (adenine(1408)-N(1))-methyltransferase
MKVIIGNKKGELSRTDIENLAKNFDKTVLDIGTGDGRFVFEKAIKNPKNLYIGIDPAENQLKIYSKKANRKKLQNTVFAIGSIENLPPELFSLIDELYINLPWGTLLEKMVKMNELTAGNLSSITKKDGKMEIVFGYVPKFEPSETERLDLPDITEKENLEKILNSFSRYFEITELRELDKKELGDLETTWAKKLKFGKDRKIHKITFNKKGD